MNADFHVDENNLWPLSPLLFFQALHYAISFIYLIDQSHLHPKAPFPELLYMIFPVSCFLLRSLLLKGLTIVQRVHSHPQGAVNKQIDGILKTILRAQFTTNKMLDSISKPSLHDNSLVENTSI